MKYSRDTKFVTSLVQSVIHGETVPGERFSKSWPSFRPKECHFPHQFSDLASKIRTRFHNWPGLAAIVNNLDKNANKQISEKEFRSNLHITLSFLFI